MSGDLAVIDPPEIRASSPIAGSALSGSDHSAYATTIAADLPMTSATADSTERQVIRAYWQLTKPRIVLMILITAVMAAVYVGGTAVSMVAMLHLLIGTAAVAASASVLNQYIERDADAQMRRTMTRPLPAGKIRPIDALLYGMALGLIGTAYLAVFSGWQPAAVGVATWVGYVLIYTPLKQRTAWNTTVGAVAGALPMLMGYTAAGGSVTDVNGWLLVAVLFLWQYPHFMAIAWMYRGQYADAGFVMTPVVEPSGRSAGWQAIAGALALPIVLITLVLPFNYAAGFAVLAVAASFGMIRSAFRFCGSPSDVTARQLLRSSLLQLPASLAVLIAARLVG